MNNKVDPLIKAAGFCCKYAFFKTYEGVGTQKLYDLLEGKGIITLRALQQQRARYLDEQFQCVKEKTCVK